MAGLRSCWFDESSIYLDRHATPQQVDGDNEKTFVELFAQQDALGTIQQPTPDPDPLSLPQVGVREDGQAGGMYLLNRLDLPVRYGGQAIPAFSQELHEASRLAHANVADFIHLVVKEEVAWKHGDAGMLTDTFTSRPNIHHWQE